jgi:hypothetical protein
MDLGQGSASHGHCGHLPALGSAKFRRLEKSEAGRGDLSPRLVNITKKAKNAKPPPDLGPTDITAGPETLNLGLAKPRGLVGVGGAFSPSLGGDKGLRFSAKNGGFRCRRARFLARFDLEGHEIV